MEFPIKLHVHIIEPGTSIVYTAGSQVKIIRLPENALFVVHGPGGVTIHSPKDPPGVV